MEVFFTGFATCNFWDFKIINLGGKVLGNAYFTGERGDVALIKGEVV